MCRLPAGEFVSRCLKTPGIDEKHARAFYEKLIGLHIDSRKLVLSKPRTAAEKQLADEEKAQKALSEKPFVQRLRAGMFVQLRPVQRNEVNIPIFMIMSRETGFNGMYQEGFSYHGDRIGDNFVEREVEFGKGKRYICAEVAPAPMPNAYESESELVCVHRCRRMLI